MVDVLIYSTPVCPYCVRAKDLLKRKGVAYREVDISADDQARETMLATSNGRRTVPQIFIGNQHVGGCDDLYALDAAGKLDPLLG
jgi:glutaredoxin 3